MLLVKIDVIGTIEGRVMTNKVTHVLLKIYEIKLYVKGYLEVITNVIQNKLLED